MKNLNLRNVMAGYGVVCGLVLAVLAAAVPAVAQISTVANSPYTIRVFATAPRGTSQPDSIVQWGEHIVVGFANGVAKDGTDGKSSTIVQFPVSGKVQRMFSVPGHNDGLRVVGDDDLWALRNEDVTPNLVVIELNSGSQKKYKFILPTHGVGYDDLVVKNREVFMTASNPTWTPSGITFPPRWCALLSRAARCW